MNYIKEYPKKVGRCQYEDCTNIGKWRRQNTQYVDDKKNWACYCEECQKAVDIYWRYMWLEYNAGRL